MCPFKSTHSEISQVRMKHLDFLYKCVFFSSISLLTTQQENELYTFYVPILKRSYLAINLHPFHTCTYLYFFLCVEFVPLTKLIKFVLVDGSTCVSFNIYVLSTFRERNISLKQKTVHSFIASYTGTLRLNII
jgi:hypothetical protein